MGRKCRLTKLAIWRGKPSNFMKLEGRIIGDGLDRVKCETVRLSDSCYGCSLHIDRGGSIRGVEPLLFPDTGDGWRADQHLPELRVCESFAGLCVHNDASLHDLSYRK